MTGPARNWCVARGHLTATGNTTIYVVPSNTVLLLKHAVLFTGGAAGASVVLYVFTPGQIVGVIFHAATLQVNIPDFYDGEIALNPGDSVVLGTSLSPINYWVSGALLNTGGQTPPA